jgi:hypothetical protein
MNFTRGFCAFVFLLMCSQDILAQENFLPGYLVQWDGDTLQVLVDYRNWGINPSAVHYKRSAESQVEEATPIDIRAFAVSNEIYLGAIAQVEISPHLTGKLDRDPALRTTPDTVFLQTLSSGDKSLYYLKSETGKDNFYIGKGSGFELLLFKEYVKQDGEKKVLLKNNRYLGQLKLYLDGDAAVEARIQRSRYNKRDLMALFDQYYASETSGIKFKRHVEKVTAEIGPVAGASLTSIRFRGRSAPHLTGATFDQSVDPAFGISVDLVLPRYHGKWSLYNELMFSSYKTTGRFNDYVNDDQFAISNYEIGFSYIKLNNFLRYKYPIGGFYVYANAGISNGLAVSVSNDRVIERKFYSTSSTEKVKALDEPRKYEQGFLLGVGAKFKKLSFEVRYEQGNGMSNISTLNSQVTRYYTLVGYRL